jgi:hypothetical protein
MILSSLNQSIYNLSNSITILNSKFHSINHKLIIISNQKHINNIIINRNIMDKRDKWWDWKVY